MAEQLGQAELLLTANAKPLLEELDKVRKAVSGLKPDNTDLAKSLRNVTTEAEKAKIATASLSQTLNQIPGGSLNKISAQIRKLTSESRDLKLQSDEYLKVLQRIRELEIVRGNRSGRAAVIADAAAFSDTLLNRGFGAPDRLPKLPNTIAADLQTIRELSERLRNVDKSSANFEITQRQLEAAQARLSRANDGVSDSLRRLQVQQDGAARRAEKLAAVQQYYATQTPAAGGIRNDAGALIARGAGARADERAYNAAIRPARELLETDLKRARVLREISQRILASADTAKGGFGDFSSSLGNDPVAKSIRRNAERVASRGAALSAQRDALDADLARIKELRVAQEQEKLKADKEEAATAKRLATSARQAEQQRQKKFGDALGSATIGGAFPALFGQGIGASIGGAVGGGAGGAIGGQFGFGLSLVGTALGAQFDAASEKAQLLAAGLKAPIDKFGELQQAGLLSSRQLEIQIETLIRLGRETEAAALIQKDLANSYVGLDRARQLADANDSLNRSFTSLSLALADFALEPIAQLAGDSAEALKGFANAIQFFKNSIPQLPSFLPKGNQPGSAFFNPASPGIGTALLLEVGKLFNGALPRRAQGNPTPPPNGDSSISSFTPAELALQRQINSLVYQRIAASTQGNRRNEISAQEQLALKRRDLALERVRQRQLGPAFTKQERDREIAGIYADANQELQQLKESALQLKRDRQGASLIQATEAQLAFRNIAQRISAAKELGSVEAGVTRQVIQQRQEIEAGVQAARDRVTSIGAQIDALRIQGGDNGPQLSTLVDEQVVASEEVRLKLIEGATALRDAGKQLRDDLKAAKLTLADTVNDPNGLNKFLTPEQQGQRAQQQLQQLLPDFRIAQQQFTQRTGATAPEFTGSSTDVVSAVTDFIRRVDAEVNAGRDVNSIQQALAQNTADLVSINTQLATVVQELAGKNWLVNVNVPGGTASGDVVGALNGAL